MRVESSSYLLVLEYSYLGYAYSNANQVKLAEQNEDYTRPRVRGKFWRARAELHVEPRTPTI